MRNPFKRKHRPGIDPERRTGLPDRRQTNQTPKEFPPKRGWSGGTDLRYKRTDPISGEVTYERDSRTGPRDRRRKDKK